MMPEPVSTSNVLTRVAQQHKHASCDLHVLVEDMNSALPSL
jgi:hypothetical protein